MKRIFTLVTALSLSAVTFSQTVNSNSTTAANIINPTGGRTWSLTSPFTATPLNNGQELTDYLFLSGFNFSSLPANIVGDPVDGIVVATTGEGHITVPGVWEGQILAVYSATRFRSSVFDLSVGPNLN